MGIFRPTNLVDFCARVPYLSKLLLNTSCIVFPVHTALEENTLGQIMDFLVETLGVASGVLIYGAMLFKNLVIIKSLLLAGAIGFLAYGAIHELMAMIIVNGIGTAIGIFGVYQSIKIPKKRPIGFRRN